MIHVADQSVKIHFFLWNLAAIIIGCHFHTYSCGIENMTLGRNLGLLGHHQIPTDQCHDAQNLSREETFETLGLQLQVFVDVP